MPRNFSRAHIISLTHGETFSLQNYERCLVRHFSSRFPLPPASQNWDLKDVKINAGSWAKLSSPCFFIMKFLTHLLAHLSFKIFRICFLPRFEKFPFKAEKSSLDEHWKIDLKLKATNYLWLRRTAIKLKNSLFKVMKSTWKPNKDSIFSFKLRFTTGEEKAQLEVTFSERILCWHQK